MPRSMQISQLVTTLSGLIGRESARLELKWLKQAGRSAGPLSTMLRRRIRGEPLQYILGTQPFGHLNILTRRPVLIPRPETEYWTLRLAQSITPSPQKPVHVLDLCTGSGCIPLLLCSTWTPGSTIAVGIDTSLEALRLARDNTLAYASVVPLELSHTPSHLAPHPNLAHAPLAATPSTTTTTTTTVPPTNTATPTKNVFVPMHADVRDTNTLSKLLSIWRPFDVITANPPYIPREQYDKLDRSVKDFEDQMALLGDPPGSPDRDGLTFYLDIARLVAQGHVLAKDGWLVLEVGDGQARAVEKIVHSVARIKDTVIWTDPWGCERVVVARNLD
ncbi:S-adenosyl-L-methionine-dependent methyltransferase [Lactarius hatsudake]|nr:S-adenosyl-L-methionine-dependent methyltransferase [Lactarius hatsudake]